MLYSDFQGLKLSKLGFGLMRLPLEGSGPDAAVDEALVAQMVDYAIKNGVNYFDTAWPYHGGTSETVIGRVLKNYPRESFCLANKFPGHQIRDSYDPAEIIEQQLKKCQVEYFDFYLLHNVYENSVKVYTDPKWGIIDYFLEQKRLGRIRHLGFSTHGSVQMMREFLAQYGDKMEFCQIQLNYLDWTLQRAKEKCELLCEFHIPIWVMEPLRGGKLANLSEADAARLQALRPGESCASWGLRWLQTLGLPTVILSGMSSMEQMQDNVRTFSEERPLNEAESEVLFDIAEHMKQSLPCTACRYCCEGCPKGLNIPMLLDIYNELRVAPSVNVGMRVEALGPEKQPSACIACGKCARSCPQKIDVPKAMREADEILGTLPSWAEVCRQRDEAEKRSRAAAHGAT